MHYPLKRAEQLVDLDAVEHQATVLPSLAFCQSGNFLNATPRAVVTSLLDLLRITMTLLPQSQMTATARYTSPTAWRSSGWF